MTLLLDERYETGPDGATIDETNTTFTAVGGTSNGSRTFSSVSPHEGSLCGEYVAGSTSGTMWTRYNTPTTLATVYLRAYVRLVTAYPGDNRGIAYWRNSGGTVRARVEVNNDGSFTIKNGTTVVATSTVTTPLDTWCRIEWELINGTGQTLRIFVGANVDGTTPDETITGTFNTGTDGQQFLIGWAGPLSNRTMRMDAVAVDDASWVGPLATGPATVTTDDPVGITDTATAVLGSPSQASDSVGVTDAVAAAFSRSVSVADQVAVTDTGAPQSIAITHPITDPVGLTDAVIAKLDRVVTVADLLALTDAATSQANAGDRTLDDAVGLTDTVTWTLDAVVTVADLVALTDATGTSQASAGGQTLDDHEGITDAATWILGATRTASDPVGLTDSAVAVLDRVVTVADLVGLTDVATKAAATAGDGIPVLDPLLTLDPVASVLTLDVPDSGLTLDPVDSTLTLD